MEFSSSRKVNNLLFCSIVSRALASLDPRIRPAPLPIKLNGFDEPTQPEVSMTESHTHCASRGHCECSTGARSFATTTDLLLFFPMWQEHHLTMRIPSFARRQLRFWHVCM